MTERLIQEAVRADLFTGNLIVCPNYTPKDWWECDMFSVTKAGYMVEHEIKVTVADFKADAKKEREWTDLAAYRADSHPISNYKKFVRQEVKHDLLAAHDRRGPSRFFYVVPKDLIAPADVPEWAGLKYAEPWSRTSTNVFVVKDAPLLHRQKCSDDIIAHCHSVFYYRYWNLWRKLTPAEREAISATNVTSADD